MGSHVKKMGKKKGLDAPSQVYKDDDLYKRALQSPAAITSNKKGEEGTWQSNREGDGREQWEGKRQRDFDWSY